MNRKRDKKKKHDFWRRIHFKYKVSIINENTLSEVWKIRVSWFSGATVVFAFAFLLIALTSVIIVSTPIRNYLPGYLDSEIREEAVRSAIKIDSLERQMQYQTAYLSNLKLALEGKVIADSVLSVTDSTHVLGNYDLLYATDVEKKYNEEFEESEKYNLSSVPSATMSSVEGLTFFPPVKGLILHRFNPTDRHYGIDMVTAPKESVLATLEGTVIFAGYEAGAGYVIQIQHKNGFVSIYKNNALLLKRAGDRIRTGEAVAIVGQVDDTHSKASLYFELWYKGSPVNPENYISF
ncbi:murein DD-endopeptidase MepM/ murein hydrolase activator NlpD [Dysgonomonas sp. PH5-45]|uniref:murein hydrolase activator EnvC family protein n=1 Tax=unclassified Dysgonomonas TaxID=2630389 RepID=UPI0024734C64|nr:MULTISPECIES: M23 family metallopeptidase [unclassified Dysgonomonas]MDH6354337.1 murein DD-endopeptidase MepM/ murein hydrolase activator NlpD [Dysgonomonas sp. PH5-45]MDH6387237.1 murein DD-endopeptidase MepM/ murein hydrolase activator NlpD [Dysgonomonas sp. PH5-37]